MADELDPDETDLPPRGRPRDPGLTDRLLAGALNLVAEHGLDRFNVDALVTATGAGKAAVYRRWPNAEVLLAEALGRCRPVPAAPDAGALRGDLIALLEPCTRMLGRDERALAAVLSQARHSRDLHASLMAAVVQPLDVAVTIIADQHAARGYAVVATQRAVLCTLVLALWWERYTIHPAVSTDAQVGTLVDRTLVPVLMHP